jgi:hypothetical protein
MNMNIARCRRYNKLLAMSVMLTVLAGCATIPRFTDQPFKVDQEEFYRTVRVVALEPPVIGEIKQAAEAQAEFESLAAEKLKEAGLSVIASDKYGSLRESLGKQDGGLYDPVTGKINEAKAKELQKKIFDELRAQYGIDAVARVVVLPRTAYFSACRARWDGVEQAMASCGFLEGGGNYNGRISAISLLVAIRDKEGKILFMNAGGIQLIARLKTGFFKAAQFESIAPDDLFVDKLKNRAAVDIALDPLIRKQK